MVEKPIHEAEAEYNVESRHHRGEYNWALLHKNLEDTRVQQVTDIVVTKKELTYTDLVLWRDANHVKKGFQSLYAGVMAQVTKYTEWKNVTEKHKLQFKWW